MSDIRIPWNGAVRSENHAVDTGICQNPLCFFSDFFFTAPVNEVLFRLSKTSDHRLVMEELLPFLQGKAFEGRDLKPLGIL